MKSRYPQKRGAQRNLPSAKLRPSSEVSKEVVQRRQRRGLRNFHTDYVIVPWQRLARVEDSEDSFPTIKLMLFFCYERKASTTPLLRLEIN